jgi:hypothetical protein
MAFTGQENPANQPEVKATVPEAKSAPALSLQPKAQEMYEEKKAEMIAQVEEAFEKRISKVNLDEKAIARLKALRDEQMRQVGEMFENHRKEFDKRSGLTAADRDALVEELITTATADAKKRIEGIEHVMKAKTQSENITTGEVAAIEQAIIAVEKLASEDKRLQATAEKIMDGLPITDEDYTYIVGILKPYDVINQLTKRTKDTDIKQTFEATSAGVLIGMMKPEQRFRLVEVFMDCPNKAQSPQIIDAFLSTGILNREQGDALFQLAIKKGLITQEQFVGNFKTKLDQGFYQQETAKFQAIIEQGKNRYRGKFSENIASRVVGAPLIGGAAAIWGFVLALLNIWTTLANKDDKNKLKSLFSNPYIYAGLGAMAVGTEVASSSIEGKGPIGGGVIAQGIDRLGGSEEKPNAVQERARGRIEDIMLNSPRELVAYLDEGGSERILELKKSKIAKNEKPFITIAELMPIEKNPQQAERLAHLKTLTLTSENETNIALTTVSEVSGILKIDDKDAFAKLVIDIRQKQNPKPQNATV